MAFIKPTAVAFILAAATCAAQADAARADCAALTRVVAAADATPAWSGVARGGAGTVSLFGLSECRTASYSSSMDYNCDADATASTIDTRYDGLIVDLQRCLTAAPRVEVMGVSTYSHWRMPEGVEVTAVKVSQPAADNFGLGLTVRRSF